MWRNKMNTRLASRLRPDYWKGGKGGGKIRHKGRLFISRMTDEQRLCYNTEARRRRMTLTTVNVQLCGWQFTSGWAFSHHVRTYKEQTCIRRKSGGMFRNVLAEKMNNKKKMRKNRQKMIKSFPRMEWETVWRTRGCGLNFPCGLDSSSCVHERDTVPLSRAQPTNDRNNCHNLRNMVGTHFFIGRHLIN